MLSVIKNQNIRFIDLFAGLGGFHAGVSQLGHTCVFASEVDITLREIYSKNFKIEPDGDIRNVDENEIPNHEMICAGFPCQPFSRAGKKKGAKCPSSGRLIDEIFRIAKAKKPQYIMLENVPDVISIENGKFWRYLVTGLEGMGYAVDHKIYTPRDFGIPQKRKRVFIVACRSGLNHFIWPEPSSKAVHLKPIALPLDHEHNPISQDREIVINLWQQFIQETLAFTSLPILASEFGATYPYDTKIDSLKDFFCYKGSFGTSLLNCNDWDEVRSNLPRYVRDKNGLASPRIGEAIKFSREVYAKHKSFLDFWKQDLVKMPFSWTKFEWQGYRDNPDIWKHIIQFRASGVRVIKPDCAPSLVAMSTTQTPILGNEKRYMSIKEAAALQSLESLEFLPVNRGRAFKALGNAVNALIVKEIAENLIH